MFWRHIELPKDLLLCFFFKERKDRISFRSLYSGCEPSSLSQSRGTCVVCPKRGKAICTAYPFSQSQYCLGDSSSLLPQHQNHQQLAALPCYPKLEPPSSSVTPESGLPEGEQLCFVFIMDKSMHWY